MAAGDWRRDIDIHTPSPARMYDYYLGGSHNFAADREAAEQAITALPNLRTIARTNRAFLGAAVRHLLDCGVRQFLDVGSGIPTVGNVHDIAQQATPQGRVVYVDTDPVAVAHSVAILRDNPHATAIRADLRHPQAILSHHAVRTLLDLRQPVGLLMVSMLQFVPDEDAYPAVAHLVDALAPGSYVVISHVATEAVPAESNLTMTEIYRRSTAPSGATRTRTMIRRFFDGLDLIGPGLVWVSQWAPGAIVDTTEPPEASTLLAGVARKAVRAG
jgi:hypothetical protein